MDSFVFPAPHLGPRGQALVFTFEDGSATIAYRERPSQQWGKPTLALDAPIHSEVTPIV